MALFEGNVLPCFCTPSTHSCTELQHKAANTESATSTCSHACTDKTHQPSVAVALGASWDHKVMMTTMVYVVGIQTSTVCLGPFQGARTSQQPCDRNSMCPSGHSKRNQHTPIPCTPVAVWKAPIHSRTMWWCCVSMPDSLAGRATQTLPPTSKALLAPLTPADMAATVTTTLAFLSKYNSRLPSHRYSRECGSSLHQVKATCFLYTPGCCPMLS